MFRKHNQSLNLCYSIKEELGTSKLGSPEFFFLERYLLFANRGQKIYRGQIYHTPYPAYGAVLHTLEENILHTHNLFCEGMPQFIHASPGVDVEVFSLTEQSANHASL